MPGEAFPGLADIKTGNRILASGQTGDDGKLTATTLRVNLAPISFDGLGAPPPPSNMGLRGIPAGN